MKTTPEQRAKIRNELMRRDARGADLLNAQALILFDDLDEAIAEVAALKERAGLAEGELEQLRPAVSGLKERAEEAEQKIIGFMNEQESFKEHRYEDGELIAELRSEVERLKEDLHEALGYVSDYFRRKHFSEYLHNGELLSTLAEPKPGGEKFRAVAFGYPFPVEPYKPGGEKTSETRDDNKTEQWGNSSDESCVDRNSRPAEAPIGPGFPHGCSVDPYSSAACSRGMHGCVKDHPEPGMCARAREIETDTVRRIVGWLNRRAETRGLFGSISAIVEELQLGDWKGDGGGK